MEMLHDVQAYSVLPVKQNEPTLWADLQTYFADPLATCKGKTTQEVLYLITDLTPQQASPHRLLQINRGHWHIENGLHYVRDVDFSEERSRLRSGNAPQVMAALRNLVITLIHRLGSAQIEALRRYFAYHPEQALTFLFQKGASNNSQPLTLYEET